MTKYTISRIVEETLDLHLPAFTGQRDAQGCDTCSLCKKPSGLVILPVRYAAISSSHAHPDALVTAIGGPFGAGVVEQELSVSKYILRHARVGYLYLHYPAGNAGGRRWERFRITEHACFIQEPLEAPYISQDAELKSCRKSQDWQLSHCITIPEPERIAEVYLAFTEQPWGRRLRKSLEADPGRRMQSLSPQACLAPTVAQPHTTPIDEVDHWVSEYRQGATECFDHQVADLDDAANVKHFQSLFPFHSRAREANSLKETVARGAYPGVIFALWDARGITCELNHEQLQAVEASRQRYGWRLHAWEGIQAIKAAVGDRAEHHHRAKVAGEEDQIPEQIRMLEQQRLAQPPKRVAPREQSMPSQSDIRLAGAAHRDRVEVKVAQAQRDFRARALSEEVIEARRAEAWRRTRNNNTPFGEDQALLRLSDEALSAQFEAEVASRLRDDAERIHIPIAEEHAAWLASSALRTYFETDYLRDDLDSGIRYTEHFTECFANGADRAECERVLQGWLEQAEPMNTANLLQRGLFLNQDSLIESTDQLDERLFNWQHGLSVLQRLYTAWNSSRSYLLEQQAAREAGRNALAELIYHAGAPMAKKLSQLVDSSVMRLVKLSAMLSTGRLIVERKLRGTPEQLLEFLLAKMREVLPRGQRPDPQLMARISHSLLVTRLEGGDLHITTLQITQLCCSMKRPCAPPSVPTSTSPRAPLSARPSVVPGAAPGATPGRRRYRPGSLAAPSRSG